MRRKAYSGKFIVFEGIDGSGKSTQSNLLLKRLKQEKYNTEIIDFPQYGTKSSGLVEEYLNGKYGSAREVGPWRASVFFACDRYDASLKMRKWLDEGKMVISDRYLASSIGHQGGKLLKKNYEWNKFVDWLYDLEYGIFEILKPDINFILKVTPEISRRLSANITDEKKLKKKSLYLGKKKQDIHEKDLEHLREADESYQRIAKKFPSDFAVIECVENGKLLPIETIHEIIWAKVEKYLKK